MRLVDFTALMDRDVTPLSTKIHLATWNGEEDPLEVYRAGRFDEWQRWQTKRNFERLFVLSLINLGAQRWLYAGVYTSDGCDWIENRGLHYYRMRERHSCSEFGGRLVVEFARSGRQSYLNMENWEDQLLVGEILPERLSIGEFPGFKAVNLAKIELDTIVSRELVSWRTALSNVAGVYLISHVPSGKLYVGSASGVGGIWQRWCEYSKTGHGGNIKLKPLAEANNGEGAAEFRFSILEIADPDASYETILQRESHWKQILQTRDFGLNEN
jgi:hypothetical protein